MIERPDRTSVLKQSKVPVLFIMGKHDTAVPVTDGLKQCHLPDVSYIHMLERSGHMGMLEEADLANKALGNFLREL
jgi:pimeloyl-ACP methyl ester carboxylesterase